MMAPVIDSRTFCIVSLDPEKLEIFVVLVSSEVPSRPKNGSAFPNAPKEKMEMDCFSVKKVEFVIRLVKSW